MKSFVAVLLMAALTQATWVKPDKEQKLRCMEEQKDIFEINKDSTANLIHGDLLPHKRQSRNTIVNSTYWWLSTDIPVEYSSGLGLDQIAAIDEARQEYEMRTCLRFVDRTDEPDYISYKVRSGCYSYVGRQGGAQTISIGNGCQIRAIVQHEMMHAIGIWHEQSRTDRDDYVKIQYQNMEADKASNFNSYDYNTADPLRVSYDYNSVMHYSATSFSTNGEPTIVTRDPAFQDIIGQRRTFSRGDSTKINRMYNCSDTVRHSYHCNFEEESICGFNEQPVDLNAPTDGNWYRYIIGTSESNSPNAPKDDNTIGISGYGSYMLFNATKSSLGDFKSMRYLTKGSDVQCLKMSYVMNLQPESTAGLQIFLASIDPVTGNITNLGDPIVTISEHTGEGWRFLAKTVNPPSEYKVVIRAKSGGFVEDAIAVDDISMQDKACDTGYFEMDDYDQYLQNTSKGVGYNSDVMYTDDGYAYYLKVFPNGTSASVDGYMGLFFGLAKGINDDNLQWPMCNRFVRLQINDQNNNPMYSMDEYYNYMTDDTWVQPTEDLSGAWGYRNFMKISEMQDINNYMKHNSVIFSVAVKDMNYVHNSTCVGSASVKAVDYQYQVVDYVDQRDKDDDEHDDDNDDEHDNDHDDEKNDDDDDDTLYISVGWTVFIALVSAAITFLIMSIVLSCVVKSHRANAVVAIASAPAMEMHKTTEAPPPSYDNLSMEKTEKEC